MSFYYSSSLCLMSCRTRWPGGQTLSCIFGRNLHINTVFLSYCRELISQLQSSLRPRDKLRAGHSSRRLPYSERPTTSRQLVREQLLRLSMFYNNCSHIIHDIDLTRSTAQLFLLPIRTSCSEFFHRLQVTRLPAPCQRKSLLITPLTRTTSQHFR